MPNTIRGQVGHNGTTLKMVDSPDKVIAHKVEGKCECGEDLEGIRGKKHTMQAGI
ncbi:MAG: hypothetical protein IT235_05700 [Bacteroidia bacterium]|nr:hypothetical protein [Bacteroidia bacterium]